MQERGVLRLWDVARLDFHFLARFSQMNVEAANDVDPKC